jgi:hypothetical protein
VTAATLFISYAHGDMQPIDWLERLRLYLAPSRHEGVVDAWDDTRISAGTRWREEISAAIGRAKSAILLVGPAFLASDFIRAEELRLLERCRTYPVVVGYCAYRRGVLRPYQAFNDPEKPLEALPLAEQNKILNHLSTIVDEDLRKTQVPTEVSDKGRASTCEAMQEIVKQLERTGTAFVAQCRRRNVLVQGIRERLGLKDNLQYENFFFRYFGELNREEKFQFDQIRAVTEGPLYQGNQEMLTIIEQNPEVHKSVPALADVRQHLVFWLNKYDRIFAKTPEMCLLYTGVEDGVPFPDDVEGQVRKWIQAQSPPAALDHEDGEHAGIRARLAKALKHPKFKWRSIERVAAEAAVSVERAAELLRSDPEVRFSKGKSGKIIVGLCSRVGH